MSVGLYVTTAVIWINCGESILRSNILIIHRGHDDGYMHFSCVFAVLSVRVTCRTVSLGQIGRLAVHASLSSSPLWGCGSSCAHCNVCAAAGQEPSSDAALNKASPSVFPSLGYRTVRRVLTLSAGSRVINEGESLEMMEEERAPSAQRKRPPPRRPRPPILQNRHLIFSRTLRTTVFFRRM